MIDVDEVRARLAVLGQPAGPAAVAEALRWLGHVVSDTAVLTTVEALRRDSTGAGILDPLLREPGVTDVLVNGPHQVFVDRGHGLERAAVTFVSDEQVRRLAVRLAGMVGRRLDDGQPFVDARLPDGTRVHAVLSSVADPGTCLSLRVPRAARLSLDQWREAGSLAPLAHDVLTGLVRQKAAFLVTGGTGSGKTTLLGAMLGEADPAERLVIVEDSRELSPGHPHCVRLEARPPNAEGAGAVTLTDLVRQALRMRPDRLIVGEVRGAELVDLLIALNTGHEGGCGTLHANSAAAVPARLAALGALGGLGPAAVQAQAVAALDAVVHVVRAAGGRRRVASVAPVIDAAGRLVVGDGLRFEADGRQRLGEGSDVVLSRAGL